MFCVPDFVKKIAVPLHARRKASDRVNLIGDWNVKLPMNDSMVAAHIGADEHNLLAHTERHASLELRAASSLDAGGWGLLEAAVSPEDALPRAKLDLNARPIPSAIGA
jgi:hypothetical protein